MKKVWIIYSIGKLVFIIDRLLIQEWFTSRILKLNYRLSTNQNTQNIMNSLNNLNRIEENVLNIIISISLPPYCFNEIHNG